MIKKILKNMKVFGMIPLVCFTLLLSGCSLPGLGRSVENEGIIVAGGNTTERQILSEIVSQMIDHYLVEGKPALINNLGSSMLIFQAMERNDANISGSMYSGTSLTGELEMEATNDSKEAMEKVIKGYNDKFDMVWFPSYGFENTYAFMTSREYAEKYNLEKISDLKNIANEVRVGIDTGWLDRQGDGYDQFQEIYGFSFDTIMPMEIGLVYDAINSNSMDIALGYSTDGRINAYDLVILEDDLNLFPPYDASPVLTKDLLRKHPELETVILKLEGEIPSDVMQKLNRKADEQKVEPNVVVRDFLIENNYFKDKKVKGLKNRDIYEDVVSDILSLKEGS